MAGITQTIPRYDGGISEQPDQLKLPGQVKNVENAIPDVTWGLYKRPGTKRVGSAALATNKYGTSAIPSGGSWFHYYRDETEGAYIGQVDSTGKIRMWKCNDGTEKNVWYATDNATYNSGTAAHTSISSYLTTSNTEDIQALTINDTTFLVNRSKEVSTTGTTTARPDAHFAYVDLLRTENGRQYSLNVYDNDTTTNISRATRIKIASDDLDETDGTGNCPGIVTQVFKVDQGSGKNLIFRVTVLGQQSTINADSNSYRCTYSRKADLLHGGEYWSTGNVSAVALDQALQTYNYTINIEKVETVAVKANIKAVRPEPTPFNADTAVTSDTILGGITSELSGTGITVKVIGTGLYLTKSSAFNVEVVEKDLMRVMQSEVNDVTELPTQCKHGYIVKVANARMSDEDDYYLKFEGENDKDGPGSWVECAAPGIVKDFDASTMPHKLVRQADGDFLVSEITWPSRDVGDNTTNPIPTFATGNKKINKVLFFRNRLAFLSGENVTTCRPGTLDEPNFWSDSALAVSAIDPIDISCSSIFPSDLFDGIEVNTGLLCFSTNQQFLLSTDAEVMNPDTAKLRSVASFNYNKTIPPINLGLLTAWIDNSGKFSRFMETANIVREGDPTVMESTKLVPSLLPKDIDLITNSRENSLVLFGKVGTDTVYGYKYLIVGEERKQAAWFKWKFNKSVRYHFIVNDEYYMLDEDNFLQKLNIVQNDDLTITQNSDEFVINIDNWTTVGSGSYNSTTNITTFTNQSDWIDTVTGTNGTLVIVDTNGTATRVGRYATPTITAGDDFTVPGKWTDTYYIGYLYTYKVEFPRFYKLQPQGQQISADVNSSLILHRAKLSFGDIGLYKTILKRKGKTDYNNIHESSISDEYNVSDAPYLTEEIKAIPIYEKNSNVDLILESTHPAPAALYSMSWEGDYSPKFYQRV